MAPYEIRTSISTKNFSLGMTGDCIHSQMSTLDSSFFRNTLETLVVCHEELVE